MLLAVALAGTLCANTEPVLDAIIDHRNQGVPLESVRRMVDHTSFNQAEKFWIRSAADLMYMPGAVSDANKKGLLKASCDAPVNDIVDVDVVGL